MNGLKAGKKVCFLFFFFLSRLYTQQFTYKHSILDYIQANRMLNFDWRTERRGKTNNGVCWLVCSGVENGLYSWCMTQTMSVFANICTRNSCDEWRKREKTKHTCSVEKIPHTVLRLHDWLQRDWFHWCGCVCVCVYITRTWSALNVLNMWCDSWIHTPATTFASTIYTHMCILYVYHLVVSVTLILERILTTSTLQANVFHIQHQATSVFYLK